MVGPVRTCWMRTGNSIPIREEDAELIPYIMAAPNYVKKGSWDATSCKSIRFYKRLSNGYLVVVEKEWTNSATDLETINIWGKLSDVSYAQRTQNRTSETPTIGRSDAAKIRKDAETAIRDDKNYLMQEAWEWNVEDYKLAFDSKKRISPNDYRKGKCLYKK